MEADNHAGTPANQRWLDVAANWDFMAEEFEQVDRSKSSKRVH